MPHSIVVQPPRMARVTAVTRTSPIQSWRFRRGSSGSLCQAQARINGYARPAGCSVMVMPTHSNCMKNQQKKTRGGGRGAPGGRAPGAGAGGGGAPGAGGAGAGGKGGGSGGGARAGGAAAGAAGRRRQRESRG